MSKKLSVLVGVIIVIAGIVTIHFIDAAYYDNQMNTTAHETNIKEINLGLDFSDMMSLDTKGQIDCSLFRDESNISMCKAIDEVRK